MRRTAVAALTLVTMAGEVLALLAVSGLAYLLREGLELPPVYYIVATVLVTATAVNLLYLTGCYRFGLHPRPAHFQALGRRRGDVFPRVRAGACRLDR